MKLKTRRIRHIDIQCPIQNELVSNTVGYSTYVVQPEESGTLFTSTGPGHLTRGQLIIILPPIYHYGSGMEFGFKLGPYTQVQLYGHEGFTTYGQGWFGEYYWKGMTTHDNFVRAAHGTTLGGDAGHGLDTVGWGIHVDRTNPTRWFQSMANPIPRTTAADELHLGGVWVSLQDEDRFNPSVYGGTGIHAGSGGSYDWFNYNIGYSPNGLGRIQRGSTPGVAHAVTNVTQALNRKFFYYNIVDPEKPRVDVTTAYPGTYQLTKDQTESIVTNTGAITDVEIKLPKAEPGLHFWFQTKFDIVGGQYKYMIVTAQDQDNIKPYWFAGGYDDSRSIYHSGINRQIQLLAVNDHDWHFMHQIPEWQAGHPYKVQPPRFWNLNNAGTRTIRPYYYLEDDIVLTSVHNSGVIDTANATKDIDITLPLNAERAVTRYIIYTNPAIRTTVHPPYGSGETMSRYGDNNQIIMTGIYAEGSRGITAIYSVGSGVWHYTWNWSAGGYYWGTQPEGLWP